MDKEKYQIPEAIGVSIVINQEKNEEGELVWVVYLSNEQSNVLEYTLVSSRGFGEIEGREVKTSVLRHSLGDIPANSSKKVEAIDPAVFVLTNEYWVTCYVNGVMYEKKVSFLPNTIKQVREN